MLVLFSDGEDFGEKINTQLKALAKENIRVFTVGVGTAEGSSIPAGDGFVHDQDGKKVISKLNTQGLKTISEQTGGEFFEINGRASEITKLISAINNVKSEVRKSRTVEAKANKYFYPLLAAFLLMLVDAGMRFNTFKL